MPNNVYRFRVSKSQTNLRLVNLPKHKLNGFQISINGKPTDQPLDRVSFKTNDVIEIRRVDGLRDYPLLDFRRDFVREVLAPLPHLGNIRSLSSLFCGCKSLRSVPRDLFVNNAQVTDYSDTFNGCSALTPDVDLNPNGSIGLDGFANGCKRQAIVHSRARSRIQMYLDKAKDANAAIH